MEILISSDEYSIIIDTKETTFEEFIVCLEQQYPLNLCFFSKKLKEEYKK